MRHQYRAAPAERERVTRTLIAVLEAEPDLEFAWLHGSFLAAGEFHDIDVGVHLNATTEVRFGRGLDLAVRLDRETGFPVDGRVLNDAPVTFLFHVFREGVPAAQPERRAPGRSFGTDGTGVSGHGAVAAPSHDRGLRRVTLNPDVVRTRCAEIEESVQRLEALAALPLADFLADRDAQDIASYRLLVAIEAPLALCYHVSSRRLRTWPADYAGCFALLEEAGILTPDLTERLESMAKFRNLLIHVNWEVDYRRVHAAMQESLGDFRAFAAAVIALLDG